MMKTAYTFSALTFALAALLSNAQTSIKPDMPSAPDSSSSDVRIVRLSQVEGKAQIDRGVGAGFEIAFTNLPITQGTRLETTEGNAEVEFEDNSTLRLVPGTLVEFARLDRSPSGNTNSTIHVIRGTVYADLQKTKGTTFALTSEAGTAFLASHSTVRLTAGSSQNDLAVFEGGVAFQSPGGDPVPVGKLKGLLLDPALQVKESFVTTLSPGPFDAWEQGERTFHEEYSRTSSLSGSPYLYGLTDLNYYGSFADLPGCGKVWRPYFASASWDPYSSGVWAWYPTAGYSWVSPYPWGWAPFHYGAWQQCSAGVWGWTPGGTWRGLNNSQAPASSTPQHAPARPGLLLHPDPAQPQRDNGVKLFFASTQELTISGMNPSTHAFVFFRDSAGLGIPRQTFGDISKLSATALQSGSASTPMYAVVSWVVGASDGKGQPQRTPITIWVPANDPRLQQQAANVPNMKGRDPKSTALLPTDSSKGSAASQVSVAAAPDGTFPPTAAAMGLSPRQRSGPPLANPADKQTAADTAAEAQRGGAVSVVVLH